jgi:N-acetylglutamate synthase-like GNAT family acetyltransferase
MSGLSIRALDHDDAAQVHALLAGARDETMLLRSNIRHGGFAYEGQPRQAKYWGAFLADRLAGVTALCWNGMVLVYAPYGLEALLAAVIEEASENGPHITGLSGPTHQLYRARGVLEITDNPVLHDVDAGLFAVNLDALRLPSSLDAPNIGLRRPVMDDLSVLVDWDIGFRIEALGELDAERKRGEIERATAQRLEIGANHIWVLECDGKLVSRSMLGVAHPDMVQVGGVWTPPDERGKGYARAVVAASLREARAQGVRRAVLFAHDAGAIRAYAAIGFEKVGSYTLVTLAEPFDPARRREASASSPRRPKAA